MRGYKAWDDLMLAEDPEAPTTIKRFFNYPVLTGGAPIGSVVIDPGLDRVGRPAPAAHRGGERLGRTRA